ncbi:MAG TPA: hypothetical protein VN739_04770 [Nitrososphaerales archaeon]|nr:hypothetical protein [Nitrososphaerales archaeon]
MKKYSKLIAAVSASSLLALIVSSLGFPFITSSYQYHCMLSCPPDLVGINWYFVYNFVVDFLIWFTVGITAIFLIFLSLGHVTLFETVSDQYPTTEQDS